MLTASTKTITDQELDALLVALEGELNAWWNEARAVSGWMAWSSLASEII